MSTHPINLILRFLLEIMALISMEYWGWTQNEGITRFVWMIVLPVGAAILWGTFAVPDDPSRSGKSPVPIPGFMRILLEFGIFSLGVWCLFAAGQPSFGWIFAALVVLHYITSYDRLIWLLRK